ncbi:MAG: hypothetical protein RSE04_06045 [Hydrogenoanaerobacterium sp.]
MDKAVDILKLLRGQDGKNGTRGSSGSLRIVRAVTTDPSPVTFVFEGTSLALDIAIFEMPISLYPICAGDKFLASPLVGNNAQRWGIVSKINNGFAVGKMLSATSCKVEGIGRPYTSADLLIPPYVADSGSCRKLKAGDKVVLIPTKAGNKVKYAITNYY